MRKKTSGLSGAIAALFVVMVMLVGAFITFYYVLPPLRLTTTAGSSSSSSNVDSESSTNSGGSESSMTITSSTQQTVGSMGDPSLKDGAATLSYPSDYTQLAQYQLSLINQDRAKFGLSPVSLSPIQSGQQHADSMLYFDYFNHWDVQGYKPYMRYTLLSGQEGMEENVAYEYTVTPYYLTTTLVKNALSSLEYQMMYNDSTCCQNGHRTNILESLHNRVSVGIEHDLNHVYLVQDFENYYVNFSQPIVSNSDRVRLVGNVSTSLPDSQVLIFYDAYPTILNKTQLSSPPYSGAYDQGTFVGGVVPPCTLTCDSYSPHITVIASVWTVTTGRLDIEFRLADFVQSHGRGVYTVYLERNASQNPEILFNWSVFVTNQSTS
jgi:uncharacterized protein YkwD